jgi:ribokinase
MVSDAGENAIVIASESNTRISCADIDAFLASAEAGEFVLLQNECAQLEHAIGASRARRLRVWLNAAPADAALARLPLELLDGLVVNETESEALTGCAEPARALEALAARMPDATVIVTLGAAGAIAALGSRRFAHAGFVVDAVDTVGCGDAFVGAYLAGIAGDCGIDEALRRGNAAGALAAMRAGAIPSLPDRAEVDAASRVEERGRLVLRESAGNAAIDAASERTT